ncbi:hypothetical protein FACS189490_07900 [Clostridia bacterium]|nr:hypothetical protein FACS189490_07900 [Clostridia bacterium]
MIYEKKNVLLMEKRTFEAKNGKVLFFVKIGDPAKCENDEFMLSRDCDFNAFHENHHYDVLLNYAKDFSSIALFPAAEQKKQGAA